MEDESSPRLSFGVERKKQATEQTHSSKKKGKSRVERVKEEVRRSLGERKVRW